MSYKTEIRKEYGYRGRASRFQWETKIFKYLKENGPRYPSELRKELKVPKEQERTYYRALERLNNLGAIKDIEGKIGLFNQEPPEEIEARIETGNLELNIPLKREQAKKIIHEIPSIKNKPHAKKVLKEAGLI